jgi:hypothetical protein
LVFSFKWFLPLFFLLHAETVSRGRKAAAVLCAAIRFVNMPENAPLECGPKEMIHV